MKLADYRKQKNLTVSALARELGMTGKNPARTLDRLEKGERGADAETMQHIHDFTSGDVTPQDMVDTRLEWLRANGLERQAAE
jgi:transcriptional regulator with XRE-family HTH domain